MKKLLLPALLAACAAFAADPQPPAFRLGDAATPLAYELRLVLDPADTDFSGEVRIDLTFARDADVLWLDAQAIDVEAAEVRQGDRVIRVRTLAGGQDFVGLQPEEGGFTAGAATAVIRYRGHLEQNATRGLFRRREGDETYIVSQFESMDARRAMPSFDEPGWKTPWEVTVDAPARDAVLSNTPEVASDDIADRPGWKRHRFARTRPLPTYLVAVAVGPYAVVDGGKAGSAATPLRYAAPKGRGGEARYAHAATPKILDLLEAYFGGPFPFEKLDSVAIPSTIGFGAMENAGMITYGANLLLAKPHEQSLFFERAYASVAAHEMAHQWFGDFVTLAWWDDTWLNEAFATWMARRTLRALRPEFDSGWRHGDLRRRALAADRLTTARQVRNPIVDRNDVYNAFDGITYSKGAEVLSMFESWLGEERFRQGVRDFLAAHAWGNATADDFFNAVAQASGRGDEVTAAFRSFVEQPGLPLVDVSLSCSAGAGTLHVSQRRFAGAGRPASSQRWVTPACFRYHAGGKVVKQCVEISREQAVALDGGCPDWITGNADGAGHWIARYDAPLMRSLVARVVDLPEHEAVALAGDTTLLVNSGLVPRDQGFELANGLLRHPSVAVRQGGVYFLEHQRDEVLSGPQRTQRRSLLTSYVQPMARSIGWLDNGPADDIATQELRALLMPFAARSEGGEPLRARARELGLHWIDDRTALPAASVKAVMETTGRFADASTYERLAGALAATRESRERETLIDALALTRDPALRNRSFALALGDDRVPIDGREALNLLEDALQDDANRGPAFTFIRANWEALQSRLPPESGAWLLRPMGDLCTPRERQEFVAFFEPRAKALRGGPRSYAQAAESIDICLASRSGQAAAPARKGGAPRR